MDKTVIQFIRHLVRVLVCTSIGRKAVMALSGTGLVLFVIAHLGGNALLFKGPHAFNLYATSLHRIPVLPLLELGLAATFAVHVCMGVYLTLLNWSRRPRDYSVSATAGEATCASRTMIYTGALVLAFVLMHLWQLESGEEHHGVITTWDLVHGILTTSLYAGLYLVGFIALGLHLFHGIKSISMSLGLRHPCHNGWIDRLGQVAAVVLAAGFVGIVCKFMLENHT